MLDKSVLSGTPEEGTLNSQPIILFPLPLPFDYCLLTIAMDFQSKLTFLSIKSNVGILFASAKRTLAQSEHLFALYQGPTLGNDQFYTIKQYE